MKVHILYILFFTVSYGQTSERKIYESISYRFNVSVSAEWKIFREVNNKKNKTLIIDWEIPKVFSELENTEIENSISITAQKNTEIKDVAGLIENQYFKINPITTSLSVEEKESNSRIIHYSKNGREYKGKIYFDFKNGIGYLTTFMATPGTFETNIKLFEEFYKTLKLK